MKNFGFLDEVTVLMPGINGKLNEVSAAFGLLQLKYIDQALAQRREVDRLYRRLLSGLKGIQCLAAGLHAFANSAYFPILVEADFPLSRDELYQYLRDHDILARRYFYPLISDFPMYHDLPSAAPANLPVARSVAERVICLPIYPALSNEDAERVVQLLVSAGRV